MNKGKKLLESSSRTCVESSKNLLDSLDEYDEDGDESDDDSCYEKEDENKKVTEKQIKKKEEKIGIENDDANNNNNYKKNSIVIKINDSCDTYDDNEVSTHNRDKENKNNNCIENKNFNINTKKELKKNRQFKISRRLSEILIESKENKAEFPLKTKNTLLNKESVLYQKSFISDNNLDYNKFNFLKDNTSPNHNSTFFSIRNSSNYLHKNKNDNESNILTTTDQNLADLKDYISIYQKLPVEKKRLPSIKGYINRNLINSLNGSFGKVTIKDDTLLKSKSESTENPSKEENQQEVHMG